MANAVLIAVAHWEIQWEFEGRTNRQRYLDPLRREHHEAVVLLANDWLKSNPIRSPQHLRAVWVDAEGQEMVSYVLNPGA